MKTEHDAEYAKGDEITAIVTGPEDKQKQEYRFRIVDNPFVLWSSNLIMYYCKRLRDDGSNLPPEQLWIIPETFITELVGPKSKITPMNTEGLL